MLLAAASLLLVCSLQAPAADWPQWRGPNRNDHSPDTGLLKSWPAGGPRRVWLNTDVGLGYSGYSIVGQRLFTMGLRGEQEFVIAVDAATGKELWATPAGAKYPNNWGDGPRGTPTVDGKHVYALSGQGALVCVESESGRTVWTKSMVSDLGGKVPGWGYTESVLVHGDQVICTPGGDRGTMAALDKTTGAEVWRTATLTDHAQYSSPILIQHGGRPQVVQLVMKRFFGVDPANGKVLWEQEWPGSTAVIPTPVSRDGFVYVTSGYGVGCALVELTPGAPRLVYQNKVIKNHHGGVVLVGDHLYGFAEPGWACQNFKTGEEVWLSRAFGKGAVHYADGMLYCLAEDTGEVVLAEASPKGWKEAGRFKLEPQSTRRASRGKVWTHPVVVNGRLYLRDQEILYCYDVKG